MVSLPNEYNKVELPLIHQLQQMGWTWLNNANGDTSVPYLTERESFRQVLLLERLRQALRYLNRDENGQPWLDERRISQAISELDRPGTPNLFEANEQIYHLLRQGVVVPGDPTRHGDRDVTIQYIDYTCPERNDFLIINQFRVDPPGSLGDKDFIIPDLVLFVNGIPLVVIECKDTDATDPMHEGIHQLLRYSNQHGLEKPEGAERLFWTNQLLISTYWYKAKVGSLGAKPEHYLEWKDTTPRPLADVSRELETDKLSSQQILVAGMLHPEHLLDIIRNFILFRENSGQRIKIVPRYQQFRAVHKAIHRLQTGQTQAQHGEADQRGGIIWHTQGSGKSLTMVYLVRKMRSLADLRHFKVVVVTDRIDLEKQLRETAALTGEPVRPNQYDVRPRESATTQLQRILAETGPDLVFATIQKYHERDNADEAPDVMPIPPSTPYHELPLAAEPRPAYADQVLADARQRASQVMQTSTDFPELNPAEAILVLIDEAHRSHASTLHANLLRALPNCARIGFTGTPIMIGAKKRTHEIFGPFIDTYTIKRSEEDGMTVPIRYEGYTTDAELYQGQGLDKLFEDMFRERTTAELEAIKQKYATKGNVLESKEMIRAKAEHLLRHYVTFVMPEGFKAQVVAVSRRAAVRYQRYLVQARDRLLQAVDALDPHWLILADDALQAASEEIRYLVHAHRHRATLERLEFAAVISAGQFSNDPTKHDPKEWEQWSNRGRVEHHIAEFKKPLYHPDPEKRSGLAVLCVKSMLLTGFDAPYEQAMYLDRGMQGAELLQAIARVNRTAANKTHGMVVDYYGISQHLKEALAVYMDEDVEGALASIKDELPKLADQHQRVLNLFAGHGIHDIYEGMDECVYLLEDKRLRAEFTIKLKQFLTTLNSIMPRPEALPYLKDAKMLGIIAKSAANLYRDVEVNVTGVGHKVKQLIDDHIQAYGLDPTIPPVTITDVEFEASVGQKGSPRAKALDMEHALRYHISQVYREDPIYCKKLSERLEAILLQFKENWDAQIQALQELVREARQAQRQDEGPFDRHTPAAFFRLLAEEVGRGETLSQTQLDHLVTTTFTMVERIRQEIQRVDFWRNAVAQKTLHSWLVRFLDDEDVVTDLARLEQVADLILEVARAHHVRMTS